MFAVPGEMKAQGELFDSLLPGRWGAMRTNIWGFSPVDRVETMGDECLCPGLSLLEALESGTGPDGATKRDAPPGLPYWLFNQLKL